MTSTMGTIEVVVTAETQAARMILIVCSVSNFYPGRVVELVLEGQEQVDLLDRVILEI